MDRNDSKEVDYAEFAQFVAQLQRVSSAPAASIDSGSTSSPLDRARAWKISTTQGLPAPAEQGGVSLVASEVSEGLGT